MEKVLKERGLQFRPGQVPRIPAPQPLDTPVTPEEEAQFERMFREYLAKRIARRN